MSIKKKTLTEKVDELIEFYSEVESSDERLKKLICRNLKDIKRAILISSTSALKEDALGIKELLESLWFELF